MNVIESKIYDLIIIGAGPGGYLAAQRAGERGLKTIIFEKNSFGGVCLNEGCIPTKALLYSAKIYDYVKNSKVYGIDTGDAVYLQKEAVDKKDRVVRRLTGGIKAQLKARGAEAVMGAAEILPKEKGMFAVRCGETYYARNLIVASGSAPVIPPIIGLAEGMQSGFVLTNREVLKLTEIPSSLIIVGGGVIGLETAFLFATLGSAVTVIEMADKVAGPFDKDISAALQKILEKKGVTFILGAKVINFGAGSVAYIKEETKNAVCAEKALISIGRRPVTEGFGLENLGVNISKGAIVTDGGMRTSVSGLYAVGDVNGKSMLAHTAYREAEVAVNNIAGEEDAVDYNSVPSVLYTSPEAAACGETLESALEKGINAKCAELSMMHSGRYVAENGDPSGFCKLIVDADANILIGFHALSSYASEYVSTAAALIDLKVDVERAKKIIFPHPSVGEIIHEVLYTEFK